MDSGHLLFLRSTNLTQSDQEIKQKIYQPSFYINFQRIGSLVETYPSRLDVESFEVRIVGRKERFFREKTHFDFVAWKGDKKKD